MTPDGFDRRKEIAERALLAMLANPANAQSGVALLAESAWRVADAFVSEEVSRRCQWETDSEEAARLVAEADEKREAERPSAPTAVPHAVAEFAAAAHVSIPTARKYLTGRAAEMKASIRARCEETERRFGRRLQDHGARP